MDGTRTTANVHSEDSYFKPFTVETVSGPTSRGSSASTIKRAAITVESVTTTVTVTASVTIGSYSATVVGLTGHCTATATAETATVSNIVASLGSILGYLRLPPGTTETGFLAIRQDRATKFRLGDTCFATVPRSCGYLEMPDLDFKPNLRADFKASISAAPAFVNLSGAVWA